MFVFQSAEEQLNRQLDWCIEQLEHGLRTQKGTPKQSQCNYCTVVYFTSTAVSKHRYRQQWCL